MEILPGFILIDAEPLAEHSHLISKKYLHPGLGNHKTSMYKHPWSTQVWGFYFAIYYKYNKTTEKKRNSLSLSK